MNLPFNRSFNLLVAILLVTVSIATACVAVPTPAALGTAANPIVMSFVPSGDTSKITLGGEQIADMLKAETGLEYKVNVGTSFGASVEAMGANQAHIGWLNTFSYLLAHEKYGVEVGLTIVRNESDFYNGQIIANNDANIQTVADLAGKSFCYTDPNSTSGYIIPRIVMRANGVDPDADLANTINAGSHNNVAIAVLNGDCDAGATYIDARTVVQADYPDIMDRTFVVTVSPDIPNDTVSFSKDFPADLKERTVQALLAVAETPEGEEALNTIYQISGFTQHDHSFYQPFQEYLAEAGIDVTTLVGS